MVTEPGLQVGEAGLPLSNLVQGEQGKYQMK
jgi:hypothetical protein